MIFIIPHLGQLGIAFQLIRQLEGNKVYNYILPFGADSPTEKELLVAIVVRGHQGMFCGNSEDEVLVTSE